MAKGLIRPKAEISTRFHRVELALTRQPTDDFPKKAMRRGSSSSITQYWSASPCRRGS